MQPHKREISSGLLAHQSIALCFKIAALEEQAGQKDLVETDALNIIKELTEYCSKSPEARRGKAAQLKVVDFSSTTDSRIVMLLGTQIDRLRLVGHQPAVPRFLEAGSDLNAFAQLVVSNDQLGSGGIYCFIEQSRGISGLHVQQFLNQVLVRNRSRFLVELLGLPEPNVLEELKSCTIVKASLIKQTRRIARQAPLGYLPSSRTIQSVEQMPLACTKPDARLIGTQILVDAYIEGFDAASLVIRTSDRAIKRLYFSIQRHSGDSVPRRGKVNLADIVFANYQYDSSYNVRDNDESTKRIPVRISETNGFTSPDKEFATT